MTQHIVNLGNSIRLSQASKVTDQYGKQGAEGSFVTVLESPRYAQDGAIQQFCVQTWIGPMNLPVGEGITGRRLAILGRISWGVGGVSMSADFDWKTGGQLSFAASFFRIDAAFSEIGANAPDEVDIGAMQTSGGRASRSQVTRTFPRISVENEEGEAALFPVPPYAHALNIFSTQDFYGDDGADPPVPNVQIRYVGGASDGFSAPSTDLESFVTGGAPFLQALATEDGVRFPESARAVEVTTTLENGVRFTPCFTLNF